MDYNTTINIFKDLPVTDESRQAMLAAIVESSEDVIISKTLDGVITSWNPAATRLFGWTAEEAIGKPITLIIPEYRLSEETMIIGKIRKGEKIDHFETRRIHKDGHEIPLSITVSPIKNSRGEVIGASKIARDITERQNADEKQAMLAAIVDSSDDIIVSKTLQGIITSWNPAARRMFGYTEAEAIGKHISLIIPPDRLHEEDHIIGNVSRGIRVDHFETIRMTKDGRMIPLSITVSPIKNSRGEVIGASKIARDISEQKNAKERMNQYTRNLEILNDISKTVSENMETEAILQRVTDASTNLIGAAFGSFFYNLIDKSGESYTLYTLSGAPKSAFEKFGMPRNTAVFHPTFTGQGVVRSDDITKDPRYGQNPPHYGKPKGHLPVVSYLAVPVFKKDGTVIGGLFYGHSEPGKFTAEHETLVEGIASHASVALENARLYEEVQSLNAKKDEFIGLASHELKTPVTSMKGYLQIMERNPDDWKRNKIFIQKTHQQVNKLSALISDLLDVSKIETGKLPFDFSEFDFIELAKEVIELMQLSNPTHQIETHYSVDHKLITADRQRIEQVMINIVGNAIKYSPRANHIIVRIENNEHKIRFAVHDFGIGIEQAHLDRIFSRFYRVEDLAAYMSGLGIGLYISKEIINRHHGELTVTSQYGEGSTFTFELPLKR